MKKSLVCTALLAATSLLSVATQAEDQPKFIDQETAIQAALAHLGVEVLGIRFDEPDTQWDVFLKLGDKAYEVEIDASNGNVVAAEEESLEEIRTELSGDLSHEGVEGDVDKY